MAKDIARFQDRYGALHAAMGKVIVGQEEARDLALAGLFAGGHVLIEGVPGLGKTLLCRTLARALDLSFGRIQCTPDLMPSDVIGTDILVESADGRRTFEFRPGPIFAEVLLVDEINRATPKTQSALLEAMEERAVTAGGSHRPLPDGFFVLATENPIELEGTYPLPEAQVDRFLWKILMPSPGEDEIVEILARREDSGSPAAEGVLDRAALAAMRALVRSVVLPEPVARHAARIVRATHPEDPLAPPAVRRFVRYGASPRAAIAMTLGAAVRALADGRPSSAIDDVLHFAVPALRHRIIRTFEAEAERVSPDEIARSAVEAVPRVPAAVAEVLP